MKKICNIYNLCRIAIVSLAAFLLLACHQEDDVVSAGGQDKEHVVSFSPTIKKFAQEQTRGLGGTFRNSTSFADFYSYFYAWGYDGSNNSVLNSEGQKVVQTSGKWNTTVLWPEDKTGMKFYAVAYDKNFYDNETIDDWADRTVNTENNAGSAPTIKYEPNEWVGHTNDILYAESTKTYDGSNYEEVGVTFNHICTGVKFACDKTLVTDDDDLMIGKIYLKNIYTYGEYNNAKKGTGNFGADGWYVDTSKKYSNYNFDSWQKVGNQVLWNSVGGDIMDLQSEGRDCIFLVPQTTPEGATIEVQFTKGEKDENDDNIILYTLTGDFSGQTLSAGHVKRFVIGKTPENKIVFSSISIIPWGNESENVELTEKAEEVPSLTLNFIEENAGSQYYVQITKGELKKYVGDCVNYQVVLSGVMKAGSQVKVNFEAYNSGEAFSSTDFEIRTDSKDIYSGYPPSTSLTDGKRTDTYTMSEEFAKDIVNQILNYASYETGSLGDNDYVRLFTLKGSNIRGLTVELIPTP